MWTWLAYLTLITCILIIVVEFVWLYVLSARSEERTLYRIAAEAEITGRLDAVVHSPTEHSTEADIRMLKEYIGQDRVKMDILSDNLLEMILKEDDVPAEMKQKAFYNIYTAINPTEFYSALLRSGNAYDKAFACRKLSDFFARDDTDMIRKLSQSKNKELSYNAAITLSVLGDGDGLLEVILGFEENYEFSHRIIVEILENYTGDLKVLARKLLEQANEYIKTSVIKALSSKRVEEFGELYKGYTLSENINLKIAAIRALGYLRKPEYEHDLIVASHHKNWTVRSAAVKAMVGIPTENIFRAVSQATRDPEWWVRYNAAKTLVEMDRDFVYIEKTLQGYDRYASEAIKYALYQAYHINAE